MFPNLLSFFPGNLPGLLISSLITFLGGIYLGYNYQTNYYEAKISRNDLIRHEAYQKGLSEEYEKGSLAIAQLFKVIQDEQSKSAGYQEQARNLSLKGSLNIDGSCYLTYGFIRLFNDSATGKTSPPTSTDAISSPIDIASLLSTIIENHRKYRSVATQIEAIKESQ